MLPMLLLPSFAAYAFPPSAAASIPSNSLSSLPALSSPVSPAFYNPLKMRARKPLNRLLALSTLGMMFEPDKWKQSDDLSFSSRHRDAPHDDPSSSYSLASLTQLEDGSLTGLLTNNKEGDCPLKLKVTARTDGVFRVQIDENQPKRRRFSPAGVLSSDPLRHDASSTQASFSTSDNVASLKLGDRELRIWVHPERFRVELKYLDKESLTINHRDMLRWETMRGEADSHTPHEEFSGHVDTVPYGNCSIGIDVGFPASSRVYGLAERASPLALHDTKGPKTPPECLVDDPPPDARGEPYRLYNLDVFGYDTRLGFDYQPLYGAVPMLLGSGNGVSTGMLWLNPSETLVDIETEGQGKHTHFVSETGVIDVFLCVDQTPRAVHRMMGGVTGRQHMPPLFGLGYHQCRWNYNNDSDVRQVDAEFDKRGIPYDVIWLDIEHTDGKRYLTWDKQHFPDPVGLQKFIGNKGRKMVLIVDPHLKVDAKYSVYAQAKKQGVLVRDKSGKKPFEGHCWPGTSSWVDYLSEKGRNFWAETLRDCKTLCEATYTWIDMNEPSCFNGPESSFQKDLMHLDGDVEHREVHNLFGHMMSAATAQGQSLMRPNKRPFLLTRSFFAGTQRYSAVWTGDNQATWEQLRSAVPMLLQLSVCGIHFCGADVGGFFGDPEEELLVRWYQSGAFYPFFRAHAHLETKRREPWLYGDVAEERIRQAVRGRYALLPYIYTLFYQSALKSFDASGDRGSYAEAGLPVMRPVWMEFEEEGIEAEEEQMFMLGRDLLIVAVSKPGITQLSVPLPSPRTRWYPLQPLRPKHGGPYVQGGSKHVATCGLDDGVPTFLRGGSIMPLRFGIEGGCSSTMSHLPLTLVVALDTNQEAYGEAYFDDGETQDGAFFVAKVSYEGGVLCCKRHGEDVSKRVEVGRVVVRGLGERPQSVSDGVVWEYDEESDALALEGWGASMGDEWSVAIK